MMSLSQLLRLSRTCCLWNSVKHWSRPAAFFFSSRHWPSKMLSNHRSCLLASNRNYWLTPFFAAIHGQRLPQSGNFMDFINQEIILSDRSYKSPEEWNRLFEEWRELSGHQSKPEPGSSNAYVIWCHLVKDTLCHTESKENLYEVIRSLLDHLKCSEIPYRELNFNIDTMFIKLKYHHDEYCDEVSAQYDTLRAENKLFDIDTLESLAEVCVLLPQCRDVFQLSDMYLKLEGKPSRTFNYLCMKVAIKHHDDDLVADLLERQMRWIGKISDKTLRFFLVGGEQKAVEANLSFLESIRSRDVMIPKDIAFLCKDTFESFQKRPGVQWSVKQFDISPLKRRTPQRCPHCHTPYKPIVKVTYEDTTELYSTFLTAIMHGSGDPDILALKRKPREIEAFKDFLVKNGDFTIVLDILNIFYTKNKKLSPHVALKRLAQVLQYCHRHNHKVLAIARHHMKEVIAPIADKASWFYTGDRTEDDWFMIWAALHFNCLVLTCDIHRDHAVLFGDKSRLFKRWLQQNKIVFNLPYNEQISFEHQSKYEVHVHRTPVGWHMPFHYLQSREPNVWHQSWLCFNSNKSDG